LLDSLSPKNSLTAQQCHMRCTYKVVRIIPESDIAEGDRHGRSFGKSTEKRSRLIMMRWSFPTAKSCC